MENTIIKWMTWGYPYFRKPPYVQIGMGCCNTESEHRNGGMTTLEHVNFLGGACSHYTGSFSYPHVYTQIVNRVQAILVDATEEHGSWSLKMVKSHCRGYHWNTTWGQVSLYPRGTLGLMMAFLSNIGLFSNFQAKLMLFAPYYVQVQIPTWCIYIYI